MTTKMHPELKGTDRVEETCGRCFGTGNIGYGNVSSAHYKFGAVTGSCFDCAGRGTTKVLVSSVRARETRRAKLEAKRLAEAEAEAAAWAAGAAQREAEAAAKVEAERLAAEAHAALPGVPTGRATVEGEILSTKWVENTYSYNGGGTTKMLVLTDAGWKVWGTMPSSLDAERGDRVAFTATLEPSRDDHAFGFFKRPTQARVAARAEVAA